MNNTFQIDRFSKLVKRTFIIHKRTWILFAIIGAFISTAFLFILSIDRIKDWDLMSKYLALATFSMFSLSPLFLFYNINHPKKGITEVMLPASTLEKFLNMALFCFVIIPFWTLLCIYIIRYTIFLYDHTPIQFSWEVTTFLYYSVSILFLGNLLFNKHKILKTLLATMLTSFLILFMLKVFSYTIPTRGLILKLIISGMLMISSYFVLKFKRY